MTNKISDFITYGRTFENYKWYKPILVFIITMILGFILSLIASNVFRLILGAEFVSTALDGGYESLNNPLTILLSNFMIILFIPSLYIASKIVKDRPFSSYSSSRGGWNIKLYLKALVIPLTLYIIYEVIRTLINGPQGKFQLSILFIFALLVTIPLQSITEEFMFRGLLLQTLGSWLKNPVLAIIIQGVIFAMMHGYTNFLGIAEVFIMAFIAGFFAWKTNGIEVSSAIHTANNFSLALFIMLGLDSSTSSPDIVNVLGTIILEIIVCFLLYYIGKRSQWFGEIPEDT